MQERKSSEKTSQAYERMSTSHDPQPSPRDRSSSIEEDALLKAPQIITVCGSNDKGQIGVKAHNGLLKIFTGARNSATVLSTPKAIPPLGSTVKSVACGKEHTVFLTEDNKVFFTGSNEDGQLGLVGTTSSSKPVQNVSKKSALAKKKVIAISCGNKHTMMLTDEGFVYACGANEWGELGLGNTKAQQEPTMISATSFANRFIERVVCGGSHTYFLTDSHLIYAAGRNDNGQLGFLPEQKVSTPREVKLYKVTTDKIHKISCGADFTLILTNSGHVYCLGSNAYGQLGLGASVNETCVPTRLVLAGFKRKKIVDAACGKSHSIFLTRNHEVYVTGRNAEGQLGLGTTIDVKVPVVLPFSFQNSCITKVACGYYHTVFTTYDGRLYGVGNNTYGQLGTGHTQESVAYPAPWNLRVEAVNPAASVRQVACGWRHTVAIYTDQKQATIAGPAFTSKYVILKPIGDNMFFLCEDKFTKAMYSVKVMTFQSKEEAMAMVDQTKTIVKINCKHLGEYYDPLYEYFDNHYQVYIFSSYYPEGTLDAMLGRKHATTNNQEKFLTEAKVLYYGYQLVTAVELLHKQAITHGKINTASIFLAGDGNVLKLLNFGRLKQKFAASEYLEDDTSVAPEIMKNKSFGQAADIFSLGCTFLEMLTLEINCMYKAILIDEKRVHREIQEFVEVHHLKFKPELVRLVLSMLRVEAKERPTITTVKTDLLKIIDAYGGVKAVSIPAVTLPPVTITPIVAKEIAKKQQMIAEPEEGVLSDAGLTDLESNQYVLESVGFDEMYTKGKGQEDKQEEIDGTEIDYDATEYDDESLLDKRKSGSPPAQAPVSKPVSSIAIPVIITPEPQSAHSAFRPQPSSANSTPRQQSPLPSPRTQSFTTTVSSVSSNPSPRGTNRDEQIERMIFEKMQALELQAQADKRALEEERKHKESLEKELVASRERLSSLEKSINELLHMQRAAATPSTPSSTTNSSPGFPSVNIDIKIKMVHGEKHQTKRLLVDSIISLPQLIQKINTVLKLKIHDLEEESDKLEVSYTDEEGEVISFTTEEEWVAAKSLASGRMGSVLKLTVTIL